MSESDTKKPKSKFAPNADQARLRSLGAKVRKRLAGNSAVYKVPSDEVELWAMGDFMTAAECQKMIELIDATAKPSRVSGLDYSDGYRTSYSGDVDPTDPFVKKIGRRVDDLLGVDPKFGESIQGQRYMPGQEFQPHHDWFHPDTSYWETEMGRGGQRSFTTMAFLNEVEAGGTTDFTDIGLSLEPKPGVLLIWNNATPEGLTNSRTMHAGRPVQAGAKYIFTKWYRAKEWF
ncbi:prolyl hydroxylase family protein [Aurantiacibacter gangjinensis]|uniref:2OG-Fe(II) oxygenase n=1 Tax=Aurantiacibacter gangjinensis TaxID=502682 RepID=A0A0G9MR31_9SPHN|nr:2OG-Fe(II) oxygenase [Aurantiacibacter gangjinensis]APE29098.1 Eukaryotic Peptidyl prolyl 4-hydroxylase-like protein, alpha subunit [Aurantiacibacter gangjinensis]KLE33186.1 2OG-Fe(II) oxygenase [Aurantiacibacter gangjinensis]